KTVLRAGDVLLVGGRLADLKELLKVQTVDVSKAEPREIPRPMRGVSGFRAILEESSPLIGRTLREVRFRERFGVVVVGIVRGDEILKDSLGNERFEEHDQILAVGPVEKLEALSTAPDLSNSKMGLSALQGLEAYLYLLRIPQTSHLAGVSVAKSRLGELVGVTVAGIIREGETRLAVSPEETIQGGDRLLIAGEPSRVLKLLSVGEVELDSNISEPMLESEEIGVAEALVAPRSRVAGKSLGELRFRDRFGLQVLALWREGNLVRTGLPKIPLRFGDALMLQGPRAKIEELVKDVDFIVLSDRGRPKRRLNKAPFALLGLAVMIGLVVSGFQPIHVAAFTAATLVILTGAIKMTEAYQAIEWRAIFLVAAVLPVGIAMERTGAALLLADSVTAVAGPLGPYAVLGAMVALSSLLSQGLDGAPAVVLLTPVVTGAAEQLGLDPYPIMMGVALAASAAFMTPFSHKANLLVMGAGGYKSMDYIKVGTPLTIVLIIIMVLLVPVFFPF
ncbi:MAG: anion permease, partial [Acidobacteriota bacterium]